jgi:hypothetical protein
MNDDERRLISSLEAQEERLVFIRFDNADASRLGSATVAAASCEPRRESASCHPRAAGDGRGSPCLLSARKVGTRPATAECSSRHEFRSGRRRDGCF